MLSRCFSKLVNWDCVGREREVDSVVIADRNLTFQSYTLIYNDFARAEWNSVGCTHLQCFIAERFEIRCWASRSRGLRKTLSGESNIDRTSQIPLRRSLNHVIRLCGLL